VDAETGEVPVTRRRRPPAVAAAAAEPLEETDPPPSEQQRAEIAAAVERLIPADKTKVMQAWHAKNLPAFYLPGGDKTPNPAFTAIHAAQALAILADYQASQPTLDGGPEEAA
jgi:hypothetical protein